MNYFERFFEEKNLSEQTYDIEHDGTLHMVESEFVIDLIKQTKGDEAKKIAQTLTEIDFHNADVHHFLKHMAKGYVVNNY